MAPNLFKTTKTVAFRARYYGYTLLEIMIAVAIIAVLAAVAFQSYQSYFDRVDRSQAISDLHILSALIEAYAVDHHHQYPDSLADINSDGYLDPWGNPYKYLNIANTKGNGKLRKDHNFVPINSDFDLYSMGKDGQSVGPLTAPQSQDDIIRANNGEFVGLASDY